MRLYLEKDEISWKPWLRGSRIRGIFYGQTPRADFILYGSLRNASWVFPTIATIDGLLAYSGRFTGISVKTKEHPLYKMF